MKSRLSVALVVALASAMLAVTVQAKVPALEREALIDLYNATSGPSWTSNKYWGTNTDECLWYGVTCDDSWTTVIRVKLYSNGLAGSMPASIKNLQNLQTLDLTRNDLTGTIATALADLPNLTTLSLAHNHLSGRIPSELARAPKLSHLDLGFNDLTGIIPRELPRNLYVLDLSWNALTGGIPSELGGLPCVGEIDLRANQLTGQMPESLGNQSCLRRLFLGSNQLTGPIPTSLGNTRLEILDLNYNQLTGSIPPELGNLAYLRDLDLHHNQLTGPIPPELGGLENLVDLWLDGNDLSGTIPEELSQLSNLETAFLGANRLSGGFPLALTRMPKLTQLMLQANRLAGPIPMELINLWRLGDGWGLYLGWNALWTDSPTLDAFVQSKSYWYEQDWHSTQTVAPSGLRVASVGDSTVWLSWTPPAYEVGAGGYEVMQAGPSAETWQSVGWTSDKSATSFPVTGLEPGTAYDLAVRTYTLPGKSQNLVLSDLSQHVAAMTSSGGCAAPVIHFRNGSPWRLELSDAYSSYRWSTGATTPAISPVFIGWYWVTVSWPPSCEETASLFFDPVRIFSDGFEDGDASSWSIGDGS